MSYEHITRAIVTVINQLALIHIDFGDRALNLAAIGALIMIIEFAIGNIKPLQWYNRWKLQRYKRNIPDGPLTPEQIFIIMRMSDKADYVRTFNISSSTSTAIRKTCENTFKSCGLLSYDHIQLGSFNAPQYELMVQRSNDKTYIADALVPFYKFGDNIVAIIIYSHEWSMHTCTTISATAPIDVNLLFNANESDVELLAMEISPSIRSGGGQTQLTVSKNTIHRLPVLSKSAFIHARAEELFHLLMDFRENLLSQFTSGGFTNLGITLYGPPGCGKTTFVLWTCNILQRSCVSLNFTDAGWTSSGFKYLMSSPVTVIGKRVDEIVYYFDEFDMSPEAIFTRTRDKNTLFTDAIKGANPNGNFELALNASNTVNLDTLLTAFDGIVKVDKRVIIASTNRVDRIDSALLRPGRLGDIVLELTHFGHDEIVSALRLLRNPPTPEQMSTIPADCTRHPTDFMNELRMKPLNTVLAGLCQ